METKKGERIKALMNVLQGQNAIHLREVAELFGVSEMTIRRDPADNPHGLSLVGGYITCHFAAPRRDIGQYLISAENNRQIEEKRKLAAQFLKTGDTIFLRLDYPVRRRFPARRAGINRRLQLVERVPQAAAEAPLQRDLVRRHLPSQEHGV